MATDLGWVTGTGGGEQTAGCHLSIPADERSKGSAYDMASMSTLLHQVHFWDFPPQSASVTDC